MPPAPHWSYAAPDDPLLKRLVIRGLERFTGQPHLRRLYDEYRAEGPHTNESFFDAAIRKLQLEIVLTPGAGMADGLAAMPRTGPLVVIANHPFGVLDGLTIGHVVGRARSDFKILTNSLLLRAPELAPYLVPIDFAETRAAVATNLRTRQDTIAHLKRGGAVIVFPGGGVATAPRPFARRAAEFEWKLFTARLIRESRASVVPVFFPGQNSRLFHLASHASLTLRLGLLFHEVRARIGSRVEVKVGTPIPFAELAPLADRRALMAHLRARLYHLGGVTDPGDFVPRAF